MRALRNIGWSGLSLTLAAGAAYGQFSANFEAPAYNGSAAGTVITGQQAWYIPPVGGVDGNVFTYAGNALGIVANPQGGAQFEAGLGAATPARAQHDVNFSAGGLWQASWDCTGKWQGALPATNNIGSWSMQDSASTRYFQQLMSWGGAGNNYQGPNSPPPDHTATGDMFHIHWGYFTSASPTTIAFAVPSAAWLSLPVDHWYHITVKWDFNAAQIREVSIRDITANGPTITDDVTSLGWYLRGGPNSLDPLPTAVRLFAGGPGDISAWDNLVVQPAPVGCYANCDNSTTAPILNVGDFTCFLQRFAAGDSYANCDNSTTAPVLNVGDFTCFLQRFAAGCP
jgi:hypothetical protein